MEEAVNVQSRRQKILPWIQLGCAAAMNFIFPGMLYNTLGVYTPIILKDFPEFARSSFVFAITLGNLVTAGGNVIYPKLREKLGLKGMIFLGGVCILSGLLIYSSASTLPMFYLGAVLMGFSIATCASVTTVLIVNRWFAGRSGTLVAVAMSGTGIGCAIFSSVYAVWIDAWGWRVSMRLAAAVAFVLLAVLLFTFKNSPEEAGIHRLWEKPAEPLSKETSQPESKAAREESAPHRSVLAVPLYRKIFLMAVLIGMILYGLLSNLTVEAGDLGLPTRQIGIISSVIFAVNVAAQLPVGMSCDRFGSAKVLYVTYGTYILAFLTLIFGRPGFAVLCVISAVAGCGKTVLNNVTAFLVTENVPAADKEQVLSLSVALMTAGLAFGMYCVQLSFDLTGSYHPVYWIFIVLSVFAVFLAGRIAGEKAPK